MYGKTKEESKKIINKPISTPINVVSVKEVKPTTKESRQKKKVASRGSKNDRDTINSYVHDICYKYKVDEYVIMSMIYHESTYRPNVRNGNHLGLMQISTRWHKDRASRLGVYDFYDPYSNVLLGVDYVSELSNTYKDIKLVLMLYNMGHDQAIDLYSKGIISYYAKSVLKKAEEYRIGG
jgi:soluble lytic murein transglycosylase-like protein